MGKRRSLRERVGDAERERVVAELAEHAVAGRLDVEELTRRTEQAYTAITVGELAGALRDLPARARRSSRPTRRRTPIQFQLHLAAYAVAVTVDVAVLSVEGDGLLGPDGTFGPEPARSTADAVAGLAFWGLLAWGVFLVAVRAIYAVRRPALRRRNA